MSVMALRMARYVAADAAMLPIYAATIKLTHYRPGAGSMLASLRPRAIPRWI
jgi:hypothetical protein